jgi:hypothetical protein
MTVRNVLEVDKQVRGHGLAKQKRRFSLRISVAEEFDDEHEQRILETSYLGTYGREFSPKLERGECPLSRPVKLTMGGKFL